MKKPTTAIGALVYKMLEQRGLVVGSAVPNSGLNIRFANRAAFRPTVSSRVGNEKSHKGQDSLLAEHSG